MNRTVARISVIPRLIGSFIACGVGVFFLLFGMSISDYARGPDYFAPMAFGVLFLCSGLFGIIRVVMTMRAPVPRNERPPVESETVSFDADAAIERYLAQNGSKAEPFPVEAVPHPARQVFGRKHADPARPVDPPIA